MEGEAPEPLHPFVLLAYLQFTFEKWLQDDPSLGLHLFKQQLFVHLGVDTFCWFDAKQCERKLFDLFVPIL